MQPRRAQTPISFRSDRAARRLADLTRDGRSQAEVIEQALDCLADREAGLSNATLRDTRFDFQHEPLFDDDKSRALYEEMMVIARRGRSTQWKFGSIADFDSQQYDENGNPR
jgi:hypothetical protein